MNSKQRIHTAIKGGKNDRIPCAPMMIRYAAGFSNVNLKNYLLDAEVFAECHIKLADAFGFDAIMLASEPTKVVHDLGGQVSFPDNNVPHIEKPVVGSPDDLGMLAVPDLSDKNTRMYDLLKAVEILCKHYKGNKSIFGWADAPFAEACNLMTVENMMVAMFDDPGFVHKLLEFTTKLVIEFLDAQISLGADVIGIGDAAASLVNPAMYEEFALPYEQRVIHAVHEKGIPVKLHMCGNNTDKLPFIMKAGMDILNVDQTTDIYKARELAPKLCLKGNLDPANVMKNSTPEEIYKHAQKLINEIGPEYYILSTGCDLAPDVPEENLKAFVSARG